MFTSEYSDKQFGTYHKIDDHKTKEEAVRACREHAKKHIAYNGILSAECDGVGFDMAVNIGDRDIRLYKVDPV